MVSEVLNTAGSFTAGDPADPTSPPQGNMSGHAVGVAQGKYGSYYAQEHGYIIGIMSVMPKTAYQDGVPRHLLKINDKYEYYWPEFANIGEQGIFNAEVFADLPPGTDVDEQNGIWGYNPRYSEYKFINSRVAGQFRTSLNFWHAGRKFSGLPDLDAGFMEMDAEDVERIFAVTDGEEDKLFCHHLNRIRAIRSMPKYGVPSF